MGAEACLSGAPKASRLECLCLVKLLLLWLAYICYMVWTSACALAGLSVHACPLTRALVLPNRKKGPSNYVRFGLVAHFCTFSMGHCATQGTRVQVFGCAGGWGCSPPANLCRSVPQGRVAGLGGHPRPQHGVLFSGLPSVPLSNSRIRSGIKVQKGLHVTGTGFHTFAKLSPPCFCLVKCHSYLLGDSFIYHRCIMKCTPLSRTAARSEYSLKEVHTTGLRCCLSSRDVLCLHWGMLMCMHATCVHVLTISILSHPVVRCSAHSF